MNDTIPSDNFVPVKCYFIIYNTYKLPSKYIFLANLVANMIKYNSNLISLRVVCVFRTGPADRMLATVSTFRAVSILSV